MSKLANKVEVVTEMTTNGTTAILELSCTDKKYEKAQEAYTKVNEYLDELSIASATKTGELAKERFNNNADLMLVESYLPFANLSLKTEVHRHFKMDDNTTVDNYMIVEAQHNTSDYVNETVNAAMAHIFGENEE